MKRLVERLSEELNFFIESDLNSSQSVIKNLQEHQKESLESSEETRIFITKILDKVSFYVSIAENIEELMLALEEFVKIMDKAFLKTTHDEPQDIKELLFSFMQKDLTEGNKTLVNLYLDETPAFEMKSCSFMQNLVRQILWESKSNDLKEKVIIKLSSVNYNWSDYLLDALKSDDMGKFETASLILKNGSKDINREGYEKGQDILKNVCYKYLEENESEEAKKLLKACIGSGLLDEKYLIPTTLEHFIIKHDLDSANTILNYIIEFQANVPGSWDKGTLLHLFCNNFETKYDYVTRKKQIEFVQNCAKLKILNDEHRTKTALSSILSKKVQNNYLIELLLNEGALIKEQDLKYLLEINDYTYKVQELFIKQIRKQENSKEYLNKIFLEIIREKEQLAIELNQKFFIKSMYYACSMYETYSSKDRENNKKNVSENIKNKEINVDLGLIELISKNGFSFIDLFFGSPFERDGVKFHELGLDIIRCLLEHTCYKEELSFGLYGFNRETLLMKHLEYPEIVIAMLNAGTEVIAQDKSGNNVLHHIHKLKNHIVKDQLIEACIKKEFLPDISKLSSKEENKEGDTALINLILHDDLDGLDLLLKHGAKYEVRQIREKCKYITSSKFEEIKKIFDKYSQTDSKGTNHYWINSKNDFEGYVSIIGKNYDTEDYHGDSSEE